MSDSDFLNEIVVRSIWVNNEFLLNFSDGMVSDPPIGLLKGIILASFELYKLRRERYACFWVVPRDDLESGHIIRNKSGSFYSWHLLGNSKKIYDKAVSLGVSVECRWEFTSEGKSFGPVRYFLAIDVDKY